MDNFNTNNIQELFYNEIYSSLTEEEEELEQTPIQIDFLGTNSYPIYLQLYRNFYFIDNLKFVFNKIFIYENIFKYKKIGLYNFMLWYPKSDKFLYLSSYPILRFGHLRYPINLRELEIDKNYKISFDFFNNIPVFGEDDDLLSEKKLSEQIPGSDFPELKLFFLDSIVINHNYMHLTENFYMNMEEFEEIESTFQTLPYFPLDSIVQNYYWGPLGFFLIFFFFLILLLEYFFDDEYIGDDDDEVYYNYKGSDIDFLMTDNDLNVSDQTNMDFQYDLSDTLDDVNNLNEFQANSFYGGINFNSENSLKYNKTLNDSDKSINFFNNHSFNEQNLNNGSLLDYYPNYDLYSKTEQIVEKNDTVDFDEFDYSESVYDEDIYSEEIPMNIYKYNLVLQNNLFFNQFKTYFFFLPFYNFFKYFFSFNLIDFLFFINVENSYKNFFLFMLNLPIFILFLVLKLLKYIIFLIIKK